ncbi:MAG: hypothetical protein DWQ29_11775 [Planctomycetota bacterium]|nr:MAG: hypothetical protein DWQ29_11775 [Planctomycetota bacterium]
MKRTEFLLTMGLMVAAGLGGASGAAPNRESDDRLERRLVGVWTTDSFGEQVLTNKPDGTAPLEVSLNRLAALRYGRKLQLELTWSVEDGVLRHNFVSGSPPKNAARLINDLGESTEYEIVAVDGEQMKLGEVDDPDVQHVWIEAPRIAGRR